MNLLIDPLFRAKNKDGTKKMSLPHLLEALGEDRVESLLGLQRHQEDAFHIFLCYLAGAVLAREGKSDPVQNEEFWRKGIRCLAGRDDDCAWTLVVEDVTKPAFMQPPVESEEDFIQNYKPEADIPDALDLLIKTKNHDIKSEKMGAPSEENWVYALISSQTMNGFSGKYNYGIARMNGGYGSRPCVGLLYGFSFGKRWVRDTNNLLSSRHGLLKNPWPYRDDGIVLTWLTVWNRKSSLDLKELDPFFIEIARAFRLVRKGNGIRAVKAPTKTRRINAEKQKGVLGDPWIPLNSEKVTALTISSAGLTPKLLRDLIFEDGFKPASMQKPDKENDAPSCYFYASVLVRGQGITEGLHTKKIKIPPKAGVSLFSNKEERDGLADLSKTGLGLASAMADKVLGLALFALMEGGPEKLDFNKREIKSWVQTMKKHFTDSWADEFFPWLWRTVDYPDNDSAELEWVHIIHGQAWKILQKAISRCPERSGRLYRGRVKAESVFKGSINNNFPILKEASNAS